MLVSTLSRVKALENCHKTHDKKAKQYTSKPMARHTEKIWVNQHYCADYLFLLRLCPIVLALEY